MQAVTGDPDAQRAVVPVNAQDTGVADELHGVAASGAERVEAIHFHVAREPHAHTRRILLACSRERARVSCKQLAPREPRHEIHMVRAEVEQDATAACDPALPLGHRSKLSRLAERRLACDDRTDHALGNERARSREQRVVPAVEADRRDHSRALARGHELFAFGDPGRKWLLEVEMLAGLDRREGERRVLVGPRADDDRGDVLAIDRLLRVVGHVDVCDAPRALARRRRRIGDDDEAHATRSREHAKVHCARDRAAADERDSGLQGFTRVAYRSLCISYSVIRTSASPPRPRYPAHSPTAQITVPSSISGSVRIGTSRRRFRQSTTRSVRLIHRKGMSGEPAA